MNVFVLCTGRCGSTSFIRACSHITNFTSAHESRCNRIGDERTNYPLNHIEADNRLSWFLGRLENAYGDDAFYVHLLRDQRKVAQSFSKRYGSGIIRAFADEIVLGDIAQYDISEICHEYCRTVNENISEFLKNKSRKMTFWLESARTHFVEFWRAIEAQGDLENAIEEWEFCHNASP